LSKEAACIPGKKQETALAIVKDRISWNWGCYPIEESPALSEPDGEPIRAELLSLRARIRA
jgi:hypothetical protein